METYRPGFTKKSERTRKVEAFILRQNKNGIGYGPSGSRKPPRRFPAEPFSEHCKDIS